MGRLIFNFSFLGKKQFIEDTNTKLLENKKAAQAKKPKLSEK
jgi:hypothetical protein